MHLSAAFPRDRSRDIVCYAYFQGSISRGLWRFIYYRFTSSSGWLVALTLLFFAYGSNTLDIQAYTPLAYLVFIWFVAIVGALFVRPRVQLDARCADRVRVGETLPIDLHVTQQRRWPQDLAVVPHRLPPALDPLPVDGVRLPTLARGETAHVSLGIRCHERGVHLWHGFRVETDFPFGIYRAFRTMPAAHKVLVTPAFTPLARLTVPAGRRYQPGGIAMASRLGDSFEFIGNREYREGDNLRDMDWRATARLNRPIVREYREEYYLRVGVVLDTHVPRTAPRADRENFEHAVSLAAAVTDYMARSDYIVDIFAAGASLYRLTAGRSLAYMDQILEILACVDTNPNEPFDTLEPEIVQSLAQITSVVCIFLDWNERRQRFVEELAGQGTGLKVVIVRDRPCTLDLGVAELAGGFSLVTAEQFAAGLDTL